jgi:NADPH:quinone reductase-like Zn-dependent oxidoreductase
VGPLGKILTAAVLNPFVGQELGVLSTEISTADLEALADFIDDGTIQLVIDRTYTVQETPEAISYLETGHVSGKVVITVTYTIDERSWRARRRVVGIG